MKKAMISGLGAAVPPKIVTNFDLENLVETSDEWIRTRTGIVERRIADSNVATSDLSIEASRKALLDANLDPLALDLIILGTATPDMLFPATACIVQNALGAKNAAAFDISAGCSGFIYALSIAESYLVRGIYKRILVIGAETLSKIMDWNDRNTCVLFADGAGASVLQPTQGESGILATYMKSDGKLGNLLCMPAGGSRLPASKETIEKRLHYIKMSGSEVFKHAVREMGEAATKVLELAGIPKEEVDLLIPHQANIRIIEATAKRLSLPWEKVFVNIDKYGNTSAASIPLALVEAREQKRIKKGDLILLVTFGAGFTWAAAAIRW